MTDQQGNTNSENENVVAVTTSASPDNRTASSIAKPALIVFGADLGMKKFPLTRSSLTIGRISNADIVLPNRSVSRLHATVEESDGQYELVDAGSTSGVRVNGDPVDRHALRQGDVIEIGAYVIQFCPKTTPASAEEAATRARSLLRSDFCPISPNMKAQLRSLDTGPSSFVESTNTLQIGRGGLLIPVEGPIGDEVCVELHLQLTKRITRKYLGEVVGLLQKDNISWACIKLHSIPGREYELVVASAKKGPWIQSVEYPV